MSSIGEGVAGVLARGGLASRWPWSGPEDDPALLPQLRDSLRQVLFVTTLGALAYLLFTVLNCGRIDDPLVIVQALRLAAVAICWRSVRGDGSLSRTIVASVVAGVAIFAGSTALAVIRGNMALTTQFAIAYTCACSLYIPWGIAGQAALTAIVAASILASAALVGVAPFTHEWFEQLTTVSIYLVLALYLAERGSRNRRELRERLRDARRVGMEFEDFAAGLEEKVTERTAQLRRQVAAMDATIDGMAILRDEAYLYLNLAHAQMYGYDSPSDLVGRNWRAIYDDEEVRRLEAEVFPRLGETGHWKGQTRGRRKDGRVIHTEISLTIAPDGDLICSCRDITLRLEIEEQLIQSRNALELAVRDLNRANAAKDDFLATMSHELRTPLTAVLGFTEALQLGVYGPCNEKQARALGLIESSGQHLLQLISDVLELSKLQAGRTVLEKSDFPVGALAEEALAMVRAAAAAKKMALLVGIEPGGLAIHADRRRLKQILVNLLANAVKFTPEGGEVRLEAVADPAASVTRFSVVDNGIGIPAEEQSRLFLPFSQLDSGLARSHEGTGLGLLLVRRFAELHGGQVTLESAPGVGSRFTVSLPWKT